MRHFRSFFHMYDAVPINIKNVREMQNFLISFRKLAMGICKCYNQRQIKQKITMLGKAI